MVKLRGTQGTKRGFFGWKMILSHHASLLAKRLIRSTKSPLNRQQTSTSTLPSNQSTENVSLIRHGVGDGVITLNVGGKHFLTLRSTVAQNAVLMDYVTRAETNKEMSQDAVFVDRDPKHFGMILSYLRNRADGVSPAGISSLLRSKNNGDQPMLAAASVYLPSDQQSLQEMYYESIHYQIPELTSYICGKHVMTKYLNMSGIENPFERTAKALAIGRKILVFFGTVASGMGGWVVTQATLSEVEAKQSLFDESGCEDLGKHEQLVRNVVKAWKDSAEKKD